MASHSGLMEDLQEELLCGICRGYFKNPVSIECGHSFCQSCLLGSWKEASRAFSCPECRSVSQFRDLTVNVRLGKLAAIVSNLRPPGLQYLEGSGKCEVHQKAWKLFCEDDQKPVCVSCSQSQEHEAHRFQCIDEAAESYREKLQETVTGLWKKSENIVQKLSNLKRLFPLIEEEIKIQIKQIESEFQKKQNLLNEEKNVYLSNIQKQKRLNSEGVNKRRRDLSEQSEQLRKRITRLQEECKKPDEYLLQHMNEVLDRNEAVLQKETETFHSVMTIITILGMMEKISSFKVDITLDCKTADPGLIISEDLKKVRYGGVLDNISSNSERSGPFALVLGTQAFTSGRCYWEVEVPHNTGWSVGFCKKSKEIQDVFVLMAIEKQNSYYLHAIAQYVFYSKVHKKYRQMAVPHLKVGIFLDYEYGEISFYNVNQNYLIYSFPRTSFSGPLTPFFCLSKRVLTNDCCLTICS